MLPRPARCFPAPATVRALVHELADAAPSRELGRAHADAAACRRADVDSHSGVPAPLGSPIFPPAGVNFPWRNESHQPPGCAAVARIGEC